MFRVTKTIPILVSFLQWIIDPLIALVTYIALTYYLNIELTEHYMALEIIVFLLTSVIFREAELSNSWQKGGVRAQTVNLLFSWAVLVFIVLFFASVTGYIGYYSSEFLITWAVLTPMVMLLGHAAVRLVLSRIFFLEKYQHSVVILGVTEAGKKLADKILNNRSLGMEFLGFIEDRNASRIGELPDNLNVIGTVESLTDLVLKDSIDIVYISLPTVSNDRILDLLDKLQDTTASIYFVPDIFMTDLIRARVDTVYGIPVVALRETPFYGVDGLVKKIVDLTVGAAMLLILSPVMLLIAVLVKITSKGPIIFRQMRYGLDGGKIEVYKFRTMSSLDDGEIVIQATKEDKRITKFGKFLRSSSLDELPQLINVIQGKMSLVGPRPHAVAHNEEYRKLIKGYMLRHKVKPGITGWAQVTGYRGETDTIEKMQGRIEKDLEYMRNWSLSLDFKIMIRTIWIILKRDNAY